MADTIPAFESELLQKIQFKASSKVSMDAFLFKAFKFFDLHNNGSLPKTDFFRAIAKCGVLVDSYNQEQVFGQYAAQDGRLYYKDFIQNLLFREEEIESNASRAKPSASRQQPREPEQFQNRSQIADNKSQLIENRSQLMGNSQVLGNSKVQEGSGNKLGQSKIDKIYSKCETYAEVLAYVKRNLQTDSFGALLALAVKLKTADTKKTHQISRKTLQAALPALQKEHVDIIFNELSQNQSELDYSVLVYDLKGQVEEERSREIEGAFVFLDNRREGEFPINYMLSRYLSRSEAQNFKRAVDLYSMFQGIDDGVFTEDDFGDCLGFISFDFNSFQSFRKVIIRPFYEEDNKSTVSQRSNRSRDFPSSKPQPKEEAQGDFKKNKESPLGSKLRSEQDQFEQFNQELRDKAQRKSASRYSQMDPKQISAPQYQEVQSILVRIKKRLATKGTRGFLSFQKAMKNADIDRDTLLNFQEFKQVVKDQRIDITNTETNQIFQVFDQQGTNFISFPEFMYVLRGKMPEWRRQFTERLWGQVRLTDSTTNFSKIKKCLNFRNHPDVQNGRKFEDDIWKEIQETILIVQELNGSVRNDTVSKVEFEEYLENLSLSVIDDKLYESILQNFWRLESGANISEKYAGSRKVFDTSKNSYLMDHHRYAVKGGSVSQNAPFGTSQEPTNYLTQHRKL